MRSGKCQLLLVLLSLLPVGLLGNYSHVLPSVVPTNAASQPATSVFITGPKGPGNVTDLNHTLKTVTFGVNVSNSPSIIGFEVILGYDTSVLKAVQGSGDYTGNVFGPGEQVLVFCIDDVPQANSGRCLDTDDIGIVTLAMVPHENPPTPAVTSGLLFHVTFNVVGTGLGQIHLFTAQLVQVNSTRAVPVTLGDGYYTNLDCPLGSHKACQPPQVSITVSPPEPPQGTVANFTVKVVERNANAAPTSYAWDWGDGSFRQYQTNLTQPMPHLFAAPTSGLGGCVGANQCPVTLTVKDNETVAWKTTIIVTLLHLVIRLSVGAITLDNQYEVVPGTLIHITADIVNISTLQEDANLTISLEGTKYLNGTRFSLPPSGATGSLNAVWNTSGYTPRVYAIVVSISNIVSHEMVNGAFIIGENKTSVPLSASAYVLLIVPPVKGTLSLSLLETTGLGILVLVAVAVGVSRFLKKPSYESEPL